MSDFLFSAKPGSSAGLSRILTRYLGHVAPIAEEKHGPWGSLAVVRAAHDGPHVVVEDNDRISVLIGNPLVRSNGTVESTARNSARRLLLHALLATPVEAWDDHLDGQYAVLHIEKESGKVLMITDRFAFIPIFSSVDSLSSHAILGTHVDVVASAAGRHHDIDLVSVVDMLVTLTCTVPFSMYVGVSQQTPATAVRIDNAGRSVATQFWQPVEHNQFRSLAMAADTLRESMVADIAKATSGADTVGLLLSGGEDSRAVLGAIPESKSIIAWTFADWTSREVRIASRVAQRHGVKHVVGQREPSHYMVGMGPVASMIGCHHMFTDVHGYGFHQTLEIEKAPIVLGGLSADSLLKGVYSSKGAIPKNAPPVDGSIRPELLMEAKERRSKFLREVREIRPSTADEWAQLWPFAMRKHGANVDGNRRLFVAHEVFHANGVLDVAAAAPLEWKKGRRLFRAATRPFLRRTMFVPHAHYYFPAFGGALNLALLPALSAARGLRAIATGEIRTRQAPWPTSSSLVKSAAAAKQRKAHPIWDSPLRSIFLPATPTEIDSAVSKWYSMRRLLLLQFTYLTSAFPDS